MQPKAVSRAGRSLAAPPVYRPEQKKIAVQKKASSAAAASTRSIQRQLVPGHYKVNCHSNLRGEGNGYKEFDQIKMNSPVKVLHHPEGKPSKFKAGLVANEHSWVEVDGKYLLNSPSSGQSIHGWINDDNLVSAPAPKEKVNNKVESLVEDDEDGFVNQVRRLSSKLNKGAPEGLSVSVYLQQLGANLSQTKPGSLAHDMNEDAQKSNSLFIIGESRAHLADRNWAREIAQNEWYREQYPDTVRDILKEVPIPVPQTLKKQSVCEY